MNPNQPEINMQDDNIIRERINNLALNNELNANNGGNNDELQEIIVQGAGNMQAPGAQQNNQVQVMMQRNDLEPLHQNQNQLQAVGNNQQVNAFQRYRDPVAADGAPVDFLLGGQRFGENFHGQRPLPAVPNDNQQDGNILARHRNPPIQEIRRNVNDAEQNANPRNYHPRQPLRRQNRNVPYARSNQNAQMRQNCNRMASFLWSMAKEATYVPRRRDRDSNDENQRDSDSEF